MISSEREVGAIRFVCLIILGAIFLGGCSSGGYGPLGSGGIAYDIFQARGDQAFPRTPAEIRAYPFAQLGVRIQGRRSGIAVLAQFVGEDWLWVASDDFAVLMTRQGMIRSLTLDGLVHAYQFDIQAGDQYSSKADDSDIERVFRLEYSVWKRDDADNKRSSDFQCSQRTQHFGEFAGGSASDRRLTHRFVCSSNSGMEPLEFSLLTDASGRLIEFAGVMAPGTPNARLEMLKAPA